MEPMRLSAIICALALAACGSDRELIIPADMLMPEEGWTGPVPRTEGELIRAALAERTGRLRANEKLVGIAEIEGRR